MNKSGFASILYQWCPSHSKVLWHEKAHTLLKKDIDLRNVIKSTFASKVLLLTSALRIAKQKYFSLNPGNFYKTKIS